MALRRKKEKNANVERYEFACSPFAQKMTQREFAKLVSLPLKDIKYIIAHKENYIRRRSVKTGGKERALIYPVGPLKAVNAKVRYQLDKIRLPEYVMSPRKGRGVRDNAIAHLHGQKFLKLDLRKFYGSIARQRVARFFRNDFGMYPDVAGLITELLTVKGRIFYGSPATPVLAALSHLKMFDEINEACLAHEAKMTLWIDNIWISGKSLSGRLLRDVRTTIAQHGHRSHEIELLHDNRPVCITGCEVFDGQLRPKNASNLSIKQLGRELRSERNAQTYAAKSNQFLSKLGAQRYVVGANSKRGRRISHQMNSTRQRRNALKAKEIS